MNKAELKQRLHQLIDELDDEKALKILYEDGVEYLSESESDETGLTALQCVALQDAMKQVESGTKFSQEQVMEDFKKWIETK